jgi:transcriptional/translational regulatory protein YebC/TACO1
MFDRVGEIELKSNIDENFELELIDFGIKDILENKLIISEVTDFGRVRDKIISMGLEIENSALVYKCRSNIMLASEDEVGKILDMIDELEENDDVINVFAGFDYAQKT